MPMSALRTATIAAVAALLSITAPALAASPYQKTEGAQTKVTDKAGTTQGADKTAPRLAIPAPKALPPDIAGECAWTGKRVISLLARDDVEQATRFKAFYKDFGCRESHLGPTFRCVILGDEVTDGDAPAQSAEESFTARVDRCWSRI